MAGRNVKDGAGPLLVIAGAGSGKTNTLAHRVGHLIVNGTDPRRILLLTFSRRAAAEMIRRVEQITAKTIGVNAAVMADALTWSGTFHAIGARLLREYAEQIGLERSFTIHDREGFGRPRRTLSGTTSDFPRPTSAFQLRARVSRSTRALSIPKRRSINCSALSFRGA